MPERFAILGALKGNRGQEYFSGLLSQRVFISQILTHRRDVSKPRQRKQLFEKGGHSHCAPLLIDVKNLFKIYHEGEESEVRALDGVSLSVDRGEFLAIIGQSGSGKSTLMNILGCLDIPTYGDYHLDGVDVTELSDRQLAHIRNKQIGFIFQGFNLIPALNAWENVELPLIYQGVPASKRADRVEAALERVGLAERAGHKPTEMSGGQQQRVAIARAIATQPPIIMADEPTGALDSRTGKHVLEILHGLHDDGSTIILITHDNGIAATAERVVRISDGHIIYDGDREGAFL